MFVAITQRRFYLLFVALLLIYSLEIPYASNDPYFDQYTVNYAIGYSLACNVVFSIALFVFASQLRMPRRTNGYVKSSYYAEIIFFCAIAVFILFKVAQGASALENVWQQRRAGELAPLMSLSAFVGLIMWPAIRSTPLKVAVFPFLFAIAFMSGARVIFMTFLGVGLLYSLRNLSWPKLALVAPVGTMLAIGIHFIARVVRGIGLGPILDGDWSRVQASLESTTGEQFSGGEGEIGNLFVLAVKSHVDNSQIVTFFATPIRILMLPLPSTSFSWKPTEAVNALWLYAMNSGYLNGNLYFDDLLESLTSGRAGSAHPTIWGDAILNAGIVGVLIWPISLAFILVRIENFMTSQANPAVAYSFAAAAAPFYAYMARGNVYLAAFWLIVMFPIIWGLRRSTKSSSSASGLRNSTNVWSVRKQRI
jgi:hypothetical protein